MYLLFLPLLLLLLLSPLSFRSLISLPLLLLSLGVSPLPLPSLLISPRALLFPPCFSSSLHHNAHCSKLANHIAQEFQLTT